MPKSLDILCPHGCYRHKRLTLTDDSAGNQVYRGICLDCRRNLIYQSTELVIDLTDSQTEWLENQKDRQLVNDLRELGLIDLSDQVLDRFRKARLLK
jgi:hypothetical protein